MEPNPYQSPLAPIERLESSAAPGLKAEFQTPRWVVMPLLYAGAIVSALHAVVLGSQWLLLSRMAEGGAWTEEEAALYDVIVGG